MRSRSSVGERLDVEAGGEPLDQREEHLHVAQVGLDRLGDAGVLDLDRHALALGGGRRWTWPIDAAANASSSNSAKTSLSVSPSSSLSSFSTFLNGSGGTSSRSVASVCLNSSRSDSGIAVKSTVERTWPIFIAAPRIWPSCLTSSRAVAAARSPVAASAFSSLRSVLAARVPGPAQALAGDEAAEAARAGDAGGWRGVGHLLSVRKRDFLR